ncbi:NADP-dependent oxidoreductase [Flavobacterium sp. ACAM 123]|uniref:NADP-dependent oxidoreductase n=1 Tax=Flavobacterium sp. ACAM 123 TaxID=1189620 RepID=UPI0002EDCE2C|nr:NADP-dependent oxidoreductase [Flavobacterium sp. ACAM 123]
MTTRQIILQSQPVGTPTLKDFKIKSTTLNKIQSGEVLLKGLYYSVDPYMRGRMNDAKSYVAPFKINEPLEGGVVATVVESKSDDFKVGDTVVGNFPWKEMFVANEAKLQKVDSNAPELSYYLSILGMTGLTAYFGLMDICKPKAGETVVVSGAAGAVGMVVGQIAKLQGCHVVGIAGTDEKAKVLIEDFSFDQVINYKTTKDIYQSVKEACPDGVDVYYDNVGGEISDAVISAINFHARIALCGQISLYNSKETPMGPRLQPMLLTRSVLMQGFIVNNYQERFPEGIKQLSTWVKEGKVDFTQTIVEGFDQLPTALLGLFEGINTGKMIVKA